MGEQAVPCLDPGKIVLSPACRGQKERLSSAGISTVKLGNRKPTGILK